MPYEKVSLAIFAEKWLSGYIFMGSPLVEDEQRAGIVDVLLRHFRCAIGKRKHCYPALGVRGVSIATYPALSIQRVGSCYLEVSFGTKGVDTWCYLECYLVLPGRCLALPGFLFWSRFLFVVPKYPRFSNSRGV